MYKNRRFGAFGSSEDPAQLASTVKGFILAAGVVIIWLAGKILGIELTPENISQFATDAGGLVAAVWVAYGLVKKFVIWAIDKWHSRRVQ
jgi:hypothetical protein